MPMSLIIDNLSIYFTKRAHCTPFSGALLQGPYLLSPGHSLNGQIPPVYVITQCPQEW